jgi:hypothetical protein
MMEALLPNYKSKGRSVTHRVIESCFVSQTFLVPTIALLLKQAAIRIERLIRQDEAI